MEVVVLVGSDTPFLRILSAVMARTWVVHAASNADALREILSATEPAIVVFNHTHPMDLFELNPRGLGFAGTILLLSDDDPTVANDLLKADALLRRSPDLVVLSRMVSQLVARSNG